MTQRPGRVTVPAALAGLLLMVGATLGVIRLLELLVGAGDRAAVLDAPAEPAADESCPSHDSLRTGAAVPVAAGDLIECPDSYDGVTVRYTGEVVRAVLLRGDRAWVQVNDDPYALALGPLPEHRTAVGGNSGIPVSVPRTLADQITHVGAYAEHGDIISVIGTFRRADPADAGGPTIHAASGEVVRAGRRLPRRHSPARLVTASVLAAVAAALAVAGRRSRTL